MKTPMPSMTKSMRKYPYRHSSSGMYLKFIPYKPTIKVSGIKINEIAVRTFITSFSRLLTLERHMSSMLEIISR
jgi:hypothetical protein